MPPNLWAKKWTHADDNAIHNGNIATNNTGLRLNFYSEVKGFSADLICFLHAEFGKVTRFVQSDQVFMLSQF
jgi:hypothetical protein